MINLNSRISRAEKKLPKDDIKITVNVWDEDKEPWPSTPEAKRKIEAERGCKIIWVEGDPLPGQNRKENF